MFFNRIESLHYPFAPIGENNTLTKGLFDKTNYENYVVISHLFRRLGNDVKAKELLADNEIFTFEEVNIQGDTLETIAYRYYLRTDLWWLVALTNNILDAKRLDKWINSRYDNIVNAENYVNDKPESLRRFYILAGNNIDRKYIDWGNMTRHEKIINFGSDDREAIGVIEDYDDFSYADEDRVVRILKDEYLSLFLDVIEKAINKRV